MSPESSAYLSSINDQIALIKRNLTEEEIEYALNAYASAKYHRLRNGENEDFRAKNEPLQINKTKLLRDKD